MTITSKYEIGETVYFMDSNCVSKGVIQSVTLYGYKDREHSAYYSVVVTGNVMSQTRNENTLFRSRKELLKNL